MDEPITPSIPSPLSAVEVPKSWFENHIALNNVLSLLLISWITTSFSLKILKLSLLLFNQLQVCFLIQVLSLTLHWLESSIPIYLS